MIPIVIDLKRNEIYPHHNSNRVKYLHCRRAEWLEHGGEPRFGFVLQLRMMADGVRRAEFGAMHCAIGELFDII
jgi:hypothetical protein